MSLDIEMDEEPYYSPEEKEAELNMPTRKPLPEFNMETLLAESEASIQDSIHAEVDPIDIVPNLENINPETPKIDKEDSEFPTLPASQKSAPKQLKRKLNEIDSNPEINEIPALEPPTKKQRIKFSKLLKRIHLLFRKKRR